MTKESYVGEVVDIVDEMLSDNGWGEEYTLSTANEGANVDRNPILVVEYPDESCRAYDIPYRAALVENIESANELNINEFVGQVKSEIESSIRGDVVAGVAPAATALHSDDFYEDFDTDYLETFTNVAREYMVDKGLVIPEGVDEDTVFRTLNEVYQHNDASFKETMETSFADAVASNIVRRRHDEEYYDDFDTEFESLFKDMAGQYLKDNVSMLNEEPDTIMDCLDFESIFLDYQNNDMSFRQSILTALNDIGALSVDIDSIYNRFEEEDEEEEYDEDEDEDYEDDEDEYEDDEDERPFH